MYSIEDDNGSLIVEATPDFSQSDIYLSVFIFTLLLIFAFKFRQLICVCNTTVIDCLLCYDCCNQCK